VGQEEILNPASILLPPTLDSPQPPMVDLAAVSDGSIEIGVESVPADSNLINNEQEVVVVEPNIEQEVVVVEPNTNEETEVRNALVIGPTEEEEKEPAEVEKKAAVTKPKSKKRKAESLEAETDEGRVCTICFESWSNSGEHRIASLRCGHFFGKSCIEKWLRGSGTACPNCNEKSTKKDIRVHFVSRLAAVDTAERDRAVAELQQSRAEQRELELRHSELQVRLQLQQEQIQRLERTVGGASVDAGPASQVPRLPAGPAPSVRLQLRYHKRHEVCRLTTDRDKCCRVMAFSQYEGMIVISQPSANPLFPGFGIRKFNLLDHKLGGFISVGREVVRDLAFHPVTPELVVSCGQAKEVRVTNVGSGSEVVRIPTDCQVWAAAWGPANTLYLGTNRGQLLVCSMVRPREPPTVLACPGDRRPVISLASVPACPEAGLPLPGVLLLTLGSLWFWEHNPAEGSLVPHRLPTPPGSLFWSLRYQQDTRLVLVVCKPAPLSTHLVLELAARQVPAGRAVTANTLMTSEGGSYAARSFLRSSLVPGPAGQVMLVVARGTGAGDTKLVVQEVPGQRTLQEVAVGKPVLDIQPVSINTDRYLAVLGETELMMYKWETVQ